MKSLLQALLLAGAALLGLLVCESWLSAGEPVEIRLRQASRSAGSIVRLGDLADVHTSQPTVADKWRALPLFPSPAPGVTQAITSREIQDVVALHYGIDSKVRWTGAAEIRLIGAGETAAPMHTVQADTTSANSVALVSQPTTNLKAPSGPSADPAGLTARLAEACETFLERQSSRGGWQVRPRVASRELSALASAGEDWRITSVDSLGIGSRRFGISLGNGAVLHVIADVSQVSLAVVAKRALTRGTMLSADQLELAPVPERSGEVNRATRLEEVVGQELQQPVAAGQPIDLRQVRRPLMVRRGGPVLVIAWAAGVKVKTNGRVLSDGAHGDLVEIQATDSNERFMARVVAPRTVEVYAGVLSVTADGAREEPKPADPTAIQRLDNPSPVTQQ